jgi:hypothetical protein
MLPTAQPEGWGRAAGAADRWHARGSGGWIAWMSDFNMGFRQVWGVFLYNWLYLGSVRKLSNVLSKGMSPKLIQLETEHQGLGMDIAYSRCKNLMHNCLIDIATHAYNCLCD